MRTRPQDVPFRPVDKHKGHRYNGLNVSALWRTGKEFFCQRLAEKFGTEGC